MITTIVIVIAIRFIWKINLQIYYILFIIRSNLYNYYFRQLSYK